LNTLAVKNSEAAANFKHVADIAAHSQRVYLLKLLRFYSSILSANHL